MEDQRGGDAQATATFCGGGGCGGGSSGRTCAARAHVGEMSSLPESSSRSCAPGVRRSSIVCGVRTRLVRYCTPRSA